MNKIYCLYRRLTRIKHKGIKKYWSLPEQKQALHTAYRLPAARQRVPSIPKQSSRDHSSVSLFKQPNILPHLLLAFIPQTLLQGKEHECQSNNNNAKRWPLFKVVEGNRSPRLFSSNWTA